MIVATAGHIDHGKTTLIRALTGIETDRLPEERKRGISIDLGFAYWTPDEGDTIAFVDVPGHERFVRNMLAGLPGVDAALIVVAADDGPMPQTVEHVQMLDLLGVKRGFVAITKCDRVDAARLADVRAAVVALFDPSALCAAPVFEIAAGEAAGVAALGTALRDARSATGSHAAPGLAFRMHIDRAFSVTGAGTVVAGTVVAGHAAVGDRLMLSPHGIEARVRGIQSGGQAVTEIAAGRRCAINLAGVELDRVSRGDVLLPPAMHAPTQRIEARIAVVDRAGCALKHAASVHLHLGTADLPAKVLVPGQRTIPAGGNAIAQILFDRPAVAMAGDRFVLRDTSGTVLLGGGVVLDPFVRPTRRRRAVGAAIAAAYASGTAEAALAALLSIDGYEVEAPAFERAFNLGASAAAQIYAAAGARVIGKGPVVMAATRLTQIELAVTGTLRDLHRDQPDLPGLKPARLRTAILPVVSPDAFAAILRDLADRNIVDLSAGWIKLPGHAPSFGPAEAASWAALRDWLAERPPCPFTIEDAAREARMAAGPLKTVLYKRTLSGDLSRIDPRRYILRDHLDALIEIAEALALERRGGFTAAEFRDASGIGRNIVIHLLEFFDRESITRRIDDRRTVNARR